MTNCWEFMSCGREPGGHSAHELGVCKVATEAVCDGVNGGQNAGRVCWIVCGTLCGGKTQGSFAQKIPSCLTCSFHRSVRRDLGGDFDIGTSLLPKLVPPERLAEAYGHLFEQERLAAVGEAVAGLAHCLRNTLNGLRAGQYVVERALLIDDDDKLRQGWGVVNKGIHQVERLAMDLLFYVKGDKLRLESCNVNHVFVEITELLAEQAAAQGISLNLDLDPSMPDAMLDRTAIYRAILNLVTNAIDACVESEHGDRVEMVSRAVDGTVHLTVADNGVGMVEATRTRLFDRFFTTKASKGTGLGMSVVKKIVDAHGGSIDVKSTLGGGASFAIGFPPLPTSGAVVPESPPTDLRPRATKCRTPEATTQRRNRW